MAEASSKKSCVLEYELEPLNFEFTIKNFTAHINHLNQVIDSPKFGEPAWFIRIYPKGRVCPKSKEYPFCVYILCTDPSKFASVKMQFMDDQQRSLAVIENKVAQRYSMREPYCITAVTDRMSGNLTIAVQIEMVGSGNLRKTNMRSLQVPKSTFQTDMMHLLTSGEMADFTIKSLNGQEFRVHKAILSARIPAFFRPMFNSNMKETTTSGMKLDLDREIVSALLQFVYSDNVSNLPAIAIRLFPIAHQYQLHRLTALCISELCENITVENIPMVSVFADRYSSKPLQSACQEFIEEHKGELAKMFARSLHISQ